MYDRQEIIDQMHDPLIRKPWELVKAYEVLDNLDPLPKLEGDEDVFENGR